MSKTVKFLLLLCILTSLAAVTLGLLINQEKEQYASQLANAEALLKSSQIPYQASFRENPEEPAAAIRRASDALTEARQDLADKEDELAKTKETLANMVADNERVQIELALTKKKLDQTETLLSKAEKRVQPLQTQLRELQESLKGWEPEGLFSKIETLETQVRSLQEQNESLSDEIVSIQQETDAPKVVDLDSIPESIDGKIVAINKPWSFVVLDVGKDNQLKEGLELKVSRGETVIGKIRTVSVDETTAVADILPEDTHSEIQVGDRVTF